MFEICPACGYAEEKKEPVPYNLLAANKIKNQFNKNLSNSWWLSQTEWVCEQLKDLGLDLKNVLDVGCGDGRYIYGLRKVFPDCKYIGIDFIEEHIVENKERFPNEEWIWGDFCKLKFTEKFDTILLMGVFNPFTDEKLLTPIIEKVTSLKPDRIAVIYDYGTTGRFPKELDIYPSTRIKISKYEQGPRQDLELLIYMLS